MRTEIAREIMRELVARGYAADGTAPDDTMDLDENYLDSIELGDLVDLLIARREKIFRSVDVVGQKVATEGYNDVVIALDAVKAVLSRLVLP